MIKRRQSQEPFLHGSLSCCLAFHSSSPLSNSVLQYHLYFLVMEKSLGYEYEVFLSFRGPDTRSDFTDYLYISMIDAGIRAYKDDEELRIGEEIGSQLLHAIEQSKISIPIFSKGYADSTWCLGELLKMVESKNTRRHKIMPIFYDVAPSEVKYQTNHYGNAIVSHANKKRFNDETINKWKATLNEVGALKGWNLQSMPNRWESCEFLPHQSLGILQQRSLIKIREDNQLWMHDWLRDIGRHFIQQASDKKPEKQQWVWTHTQASEIMEKMQIGGNVRGIDSIEAICLKLDEVSEYSLIKECLARLFNLRFLQVDSKDLDGKTKSCLTQVGHFLCYRCLNFFQTTFGPLILPELRWLSWNYFPMIFKLPNFSPRKLVILDLSMSKITEKWNGWSHIKLAKNLKVLNLTECQKLHKTPDFSFHENLERLILERCESLVQIDPSISHLKKLVFLNLKYCHNLQKLPDEMGALESLMELLLDYTSIEEIPEWRRMKKLEILSLDTCTSLSRFSLVGCTASATKLSLVDIHLTQLPKSIENFNSLIELHLSGSRIEELPNSIGNMKNLKVLKMGNSFVKKLPSAIGMLEKLEELKVGGPYFGGEIPGNIGKLQFLRILVLRSTRISVVPQLPESLITLHFYTFSMEMMPDLSNLLNLRTLQLRVFYAGPSKLEESPSPWWIGRLRMLNFLDLYTSRITSLPSDVVFLSKLKQLLLRCRNLQCLPRLPTNLSYLGIKFCKRIKTTNDLSNLKALLNLEILDCEELIEIQGIEGLENLRTLKLSTLPSLAKLLDLTNLKKLKKIDLNDCTNLSEIQGSPESLEILDITKCFKLQRLPDRSSFKNIRVWYINAPEREIGFD